MKQHSMTRWVLASALAFAVLAHAGDTVKLDVKLGLWEVTTHGKAGGQVPDEMLQRVPPERREQMIAAMRAAAERPMTRRECLTAAKLAKGFGLEGERASCHRMVDSNTSSSMSITETCNDGEGSRVMKMHFEAVNKETVTGTINMVMSRGGQSMTMDRDFQAKWLGADCGSVKE
jgi:Protein of unknown function (DUF3617)